MNKLTSKQLRQKFLDFYASKGHTILPSASLLPKEDPTLLFVNSGMYPLVPYLMGEEYPNKVVRLADSQKCIRTADIEEVGDNRHLSMFEMLGSWSLGNYFKEESLEWGFEFLTKELGLDPKRLFVTVYKGSQNMSADTESIDIWTKLFQSVGIEPTIGVEYDFENDKGGEYIYKITQKSGKDNWWGLPYRGPCGPCSEIYYLLDHNDLDFKFTDSKTAEIFVEEQIVEIWNHVFMAFEGEYGEHSEPKNLVPLKQKNIDTGMGFERLLMILQGVDTAQKTDALVPISQICQKYATKPVEANDKNYSYIVADHIRSSCMIMAEGIQPGAKGRNYILRRLIRRSLSASMQMGIDIANPNYFEDLVEAVTEIYDQVYPEVLESKDFILTHLTNEANKYQKAIAIGKKEWAKILV